MAFTPITVTFTFTDSDNTPLAGTVSFTLSAAIQQGTPVNQFVVPTTRRAILDSSGSGSIVLCANNDPATEPVGSSYIVVVALIGITLPTYNIVVPYDAVDGTIDLSELAPTS